MKKLYTRSPILGGRSSNSKHMKLNKDPSWAGQPQWSFPTLQKFSGDSDVIGYVNSGTMLISSSGLSGKSCCSWICISLGELNRCMKAKDTFPKQSNHWITGYQWKSVVYSADEEKAKKNVQNLSVFMLRSSRHYLRKNYGKCQGMDFASKELIKRDGCPGPGLSLKLQNKVLPSAATFTDALDQA